MHAVCKPGDIVAIESPMYFDTLQSLEAHGLRALEIPTHQQDGISLGALKFAIEHNPIKAVLVISNFNNPLGNCIPDHKKKELVEWLKFTANAATATLPQMAVAEFLASGGYDYHLRHIRREYARNVNLLAQAVMRYFPPETRVARPSGGIVLWVQLPQNVDSLELYKLALQSNITIAPGYLLSATDQYSNYIRLNAAAWSYPIERAVESLGELVGTMVSSWPGELTPSVLA